MMIDFIFGDIDKEEIYSFTFHIKRSDFDLAQFQR